MATFFNRATLSYNDVTTTSNTVSGELVGSLTMTKTALTDSYTAGDTVTYVVNIVNSGSTAFPSLSLSDDLGAYTFGSGSVTPLTYTDGSLAVFVNGVPTGGAVVGGTSPLSVTGLSVPAGGVTTVVYQATVNEFAPPVSGSSITNNASLTSPLLGEVATASATVTVGSRPLLSIEKALTPSTVTPGGEITYTFTIRNFGTAPAVATDNVILSDTFDPILSDISVTYNGAPLSSPDDYTYDEATGEFRTAVGTITLPAATFTQDPVTGEWSTTPSSVVLTVTGRT